MDLCYTHKFILNPVIVEKPTLHQYIDCAQLDLHPNHGFYIIDDADQTPIWQKTMVTNEEDMYRDLTMIVCARHNEYKQEETDENTQRIRKTSNIQDRCIETLTKCPDILLKLFHWKSIPCTTLNVLSSISVLILVCLWFIIQEICKKILFGFILDDGYVFWYFLTEYVPYYGSSPLYKIKRRQQAYERYYKMEQTRVGIGECVIAMHAFDEQPTVLLECGHRFCKSCIKDVERHYSAEKTVLFYLNECGVCKYKYTSINKWNYDDSKGWPWSYQFEWHFKY